MTTSTSSLLAALAATALVLPLSGASALAPDPVALKSAAYPQPKGGSWTLTDSFGDSKATLTVKPGAKGKAPSVKKIEITVLQQDNGAECPPPGAVLEVKGSFPLRKAPTWAEDDYHNKFAWISAKKDRPYDSDYPNELGMQVVPATVSIGAQQRSADLAISFVKAKRNKPHYADLSLRLYTSDGTTGWCRFDLENP
jgi:hypothetical protein